MKINIQVTKLTLFTDGSFGLLHLLATSWECTDKTVDTQDITTLWALLGHILSLLGQKIANLDSTTLWALFYHIVVASRSLISSLRA